MGSRRLLRWMKQPLVDIVEINKRLDIVEEFVGEIRGIGVLVGAFIGDAVGVMHGEDEVSAVDLKMVDDRLVERSDGLLIRQLAQHLFRVHPVLHAAQRDHADFQP